MWQQLLSKIPITKQLNFESCNMEQRPPINAPISFESACKMDETIRDLTTKSLQELDQIRGCISGQFTKEEHLKAAYHDMRSIDSTLDRWNNLLEVQTDCTVRWLQSKFQLASSKHNWDPNIWFDAQHERNTASDSGVCDGEHWFSFVDALRIGPYISHPWGPMLSALIVKEIMSYIDGENEGKQAVNILDVGCGVGSFGDKLQMLNRNRIKINIDGVDRSNNSLDRIEMNEDVYRRTLNLDLCDANEINKIKQNAQNELYDIIVSTDCLQMAYGNDYCPGSQTVQDLMQLVKPNGYLLIVTTLQNVGTYKVVCMFDDILKEKWIEHGFECIADLTMRGFGDFVVKYADQHQRHSIENNISFVKLMHRVAE